MVADLDRLTRTTRLEEPKLLVDLATVPGGTAALSQLVVESNNLYLLDTGSGWVHKYLLGLTGDTLTKDPSAILLRRGDERDGAVLAAPLDITHLPVGDLGGPVSLLVLDRNRLLLEYQPQSGIRLLPLRDADAWESVAAVRGYRGNLYILDPAANQVWRYIPTA